MSSVYSASWLVRASQGAQGHLLKVRMRILVDQARQDSLGEVDHFLEVLRVPGVLGAQLHFPLGGAVAEGQRSGHER
jgi:hypothetical protein